MQMFFQLLLAHNNGKVSYIFIFAVSLSLETKQITIIFHIAHPPQEVHKHDV